MRFALLGDTPDLLDLTTAALRAGHTLIAMTETGAIGRELQRVAPRARCDAPWQTLLDPQWVDAVFVGRAEDEEHRGEQLRALVQAGGGLLTVHPLSDSMLLYFELAIIQREAHGLLVPYVADAWHPAVEELMGIVAVGGAEFGDVEQVTFQRAMRARTRKSVLRQLASDAYLLQLIVGAPNQLNAVAGPEGDTRYERLAVQLSTPAEVPVGWSVCPASGGEAGTLTLVGTHGRATLHMPRDGQPWSMDRQRRGATDRHAYDAVDLPARGIADFAAALSTAQLDPRWETAARSVEMAEAVETSLEKGKRVVLLPEEHSESATFRGTMTSVGCGLLLVAMLALLVAGASDALRLPIPRLWSGILLAMLVLFLLLQLLPKIVLPAPRNGEADPAGGEDRPQSEETRS